MGPFAALISFVMVALVATSPAPAADAAADWEESLYRRDPVLYRATCCGNSACGCKRCFEC
ncbi:hypothetical protein PG995_008075 [Apiospora arundinis]